MKIDNNYRIEKDTYSWMLIYEYEHIPESGKNKGETIISQKAWYYPTMKSCLMGYVSQKADPNNTTLDGLIAQLIKIEKTISNINP